MKKIAIMQPYIFPYIGYFQLINAVDTFIFYDDVNFIKQGWINRNKILLNGEEYLFTVPIEKISSFKTIGDTQINEKEYNVWLKKFLKSLQQHYQKAPYSNQVFSLVKDVMTENNHNISDLAKKSVLKVANYLQLDTELKLSSNIYHNNELSGQKRVLDICKKEAANIYINVPGGKELYNSNDFTTKEVQLKFLKPKEMPYQQFKNPFIPWLSIIDILMFNSPSETINMLNKYELE